MERHRSEVSVFVANQLFNGCFAVRSAICTVIGPLIRNENESVMSVIIENKRMDDISLFETNKQQLKPEPREEQVDQHSRHVEGHPRRKVESSRCAK